MLPIAWIYVPRGKFPPEKPWTFLAKLEYVQWKGLNMCKMWHYQFYCWFYCKGLEKNALTVKSRSITFKQKPFISFSSYEQPILRNTDFNFTNLRCCQVFWSFFNNYSSYISVVFLYFDLNWKLLPFKKKVKIREIRDSYWLFIWAEWDTTCMSKE